jgi:hypothetical protein
MNHAERVARTAAGFESAMDRFLARVEAVTGDEAVRPAPGGGWSIAGITWHVAVANEGFAGLVDGSRPLAQAPEPDFAETPFHEIVAELPERLEAPDSLHPPDGLTMEMALERLRESRRRFVDVYRNLPEERGSWTIRSILGRLTVAQVGDWATAHVARHNAQAKRALQHREG